VDDKIISFVGCSAKTASGCRSPRAWTPSGRSTSSASAAALGVKDVLRATLVKRAADVPTYDSALRPLFLRHRRDREGAESRSMEAMELDPAEYQQLLEDLAKFLAEQGIEPSELTRALLAQDTARLEQLLRNARQQSGVQRIERSFQEGQYSQGCSRPSASATSRASCNRSATRLGAGEPDPRRQQMGRFVDRRLQELQEMIRRLVRGELEQRDVGQRDAARMQALAEKSFYYLSEDEIRRMKEAVTKLAQRLKNVLAVKRRSSRKGKFDVKDTLRKNLQYGGVPFKIRSTSASA
jgi:uncharacterized protein with von Willebrand factor type A (vWA) domain